MPRRLTRDSQNAILGGVAAGFAAYFDLDPVLVRIGFILLALLHGVGVLVYLVCWVIMPRREARVAAPAAPPPSRAETGTEEPGSGFAVPPAEGGSAAEAAGGEGAPADKFVGDVRQAGERMVDAIRRPVAGSNRGRIIAGTILILVGLVFLAERFTWFYWPFWFDFWDLWPVIVIGAGLVLMAGALRGRMS